MSHQGTHVRITLARAPSFVRSCPDLRVVCSVASRRVLPRQPQRGNVRVRQRAPLRCKQAQSARRRSERQSNTRPKWFCIHPTPVPRLSSLLPCLLVLLVSPSRRYGRLFLACSLSCSSRLPNSSRSAVRRLHTTQSTRHTRQHTKRRALFRAPCCSCARVVSAAMYVGPWQEYRLGQLFGAQTRLLAEAVRQQIHEQIRAEQELQPQVQLQSQTRGRHASSHSGSLRNGQRVAPTGGQPHPPQLRVHVDPHATSQLSTPTSAASASSTPVLPPLQAAARAAVNSLQASRLRATAAHPLAHVVGSYYPEALSALSTPTHSQQTSSRDSIASEPPLYSGGNPALLYRPPPMRRRRKEANGAHAAISHKQHIQRLRSLYGLQASAKGEEESKDGVDVSDSTMHSRASSSASIHSQAQMTLPRVAGATHGHISPTDSLRMLAAAQPPAPALPPAPLPIITKGTLAMYGPLPTSVQDSLHFYASGGTTGGAPAPLPVHDDMQTQSPPIMKSTSMPAVRGASPDAASSLDWLADLRTPSIPRVDGPSVARTPAITLRQYGDTVYSQPVIAAASPTPPPQEGDAAEADRIRAILAQRRTSITPTYESIVAAAAAEAASLPPLTSSASQAGLLAARSQQQSVPGAKLSAEARFMAGAHATPTQLHAPTSRDLHSSGGFSDSADFEDEVDDLLGWAENVSTDVSPRHTPSGRRSEMRRDQTYR